MEDVLQLAEDLWTGKTTTHDHHPFRPPFGLVNIAEKTWFYKGFANTILLETDEGMAMVDPGGIADAKNKFEDIRQAMEARLHTAVFSHGHYDHVYGVPYYVEEAKSQGWSKPQVVAHQALPDRFLRYAESNGWNSCINKRQFAGGIGMNDGNNLPVEFYQPDQLYEDRLELNIGGREILLRHSRGETDDHTWAFCKQSRVLSTGDLFIWAVPNGGNPQKVQRYVKEWAAAFREMAALKPVALLPGHGVPILGEDRVNQALEDSAELLESILRQTLDLMNQGASLDTVIHTVKMPAHLVDKPYLQPVYDEPEFLARNVWRFYGGWYDGTPSHLKPAPEKAQAEEIARLAGGADKLIARAQQLMSAGDERLATHLADWAWLSCGEDAAVLKGVQRVYEERARQESSTMAMGIFITAARDAGGGDLEDEMLNRNTIRAQERRAQMKKEKQG